MALGDLFYKVKDKATGLFNRFFYDDTASQNNAEEADEAMKPQMQFAQPGQSFAPQPQFQQQTPQGYDPFRQAQPGYQPGQPYQQAPVAYQAQAAAYQNQQQYQPQQPLYQQPLYQPPQQPQQGQTQQGQPLYSQFSAQMPPQQRNRRMQQHMQQEPENVVPFPGAYQPQNEGPQQPSGNEGTLNARIINVRGINDCRSAISLLRAGDALIVVMDSVSDPAEMRRYVDTLSGACFSLSATITKVSRYGAYFLAPASILVYADQTTSQMNSMPRPAMAPRYGANYQQAQPQFAREPYAQQPDPQGFERRMPAPEMTQGAFYAQRAQPPVAPSFEAQPVGYGYAPDRMEAAE